MSQPQTPQPPKANAAGALGKVKMQLKPKASPTEGTKPKARPTGGTKPKAPLKGSVALAQVKQDIHGMLS